MSEASARPTAAKALYLSYDGMCDPLGQSQVLPYLAGLAKRGHRISLVSFEKRQSTSVERATVESICASAGIHWHPLVYHKRPPVLSAMYDIRAMARLAGRLHRRERFDLVHCRSDLPALVGLKMKRRSSVPFIFDMRGFWADEKLEGGAWPQSNPLFRAVYRHFKRREAQFLDEAAHVVSLTEQGRKVIVDGRGVRAEGAPVSVIPCCVDFDVFSPADRKRREGARSQLGIAPNARVLAYLGSLGGNYMLEEMLDFFDVMRSRYADAKFLFVTQGPPEQIIAAAGAMGIPESQLIVRAARRAEVAKLIGAADLGIAFKQPTFSSKACSPTKLGEMLALELPMVTNDGVGDVARIIEETGGGVVVRDFVRAAYERALDALAGLSSDRERWRAGARHWFDLDTGIDRYDAIYRSVVVTGQEWPHGG